MVCGGGRQHRYRARAFQDFGDAGAVVTRHVTIAEPCSRSYRTILEPPGGARSRRVRLGLLFAKNNPRREYPNQTSDWIDRTLLPRRILRIFLELSSHAPQPSRAPPQAGTSTPLHSYSNAAHVISFRGDGYRLSIARGVHSQAR
jgi:hypothetical protein